MGLKKNIFGILALSFLLIFIPVLCCCLTGFGSQALAAAQKFTGPSPVHKCCDSQTTSKPSQQDSSQCDCPNHSLIKVMDVPLGGVEVISAQDQSRPESNISLSMTVPDDSSRFVSAYQIANSPPRDLGNPCYIEFRTLRL